MIRGTSQQGYLGVVAAFLGLDLQDQLAKIATPTLFMGGALDKVGGPEALMRTMAQSVSGASYQAVPEAAHIANLQNENGYNGILRAFLDQHA